MCLEWAQHRCDFCLCSTDCGVQQQVCPLTRPFQSPGHACKPLSGHDTPWTLPPNQESSIQPSAASPGLCRSSIFSSFRPFTFYTPLAKENHKKGTIQEQEIMALEWLLRVYRCRTSAGPCNAGIDAGKQVHCQTQLGHP